MEAEAVAGSCQRQGCQSVQAQVRAQTGGSAMRTPKLGLLTADLRGTPAVLVLALRMASSAL